MRESLSAGEPNGDRIKLPADVRPFEEVEKLFQITKARLRQLDGDAVSKLRHPSRNKLREDLV